MPTKIDPIRASTYGATAVTVFFISCWLLIVSQWMPQAKAVVVLFTHADPHEIEALLLGTPLAAMIGLALGVAAALLFNLVAGFFDRGGGPAPN